MVAEIVDFFMAPLLRVPIEQIVRETIDEHDDDIVELNQTQLAAGLTGNGDTISPFYKPATVKVRRKAGLQTDHVDLKQKGGFYKGEFARRTTGGTEIGSNDPKAPFLVRRYGEGIFDLTPASKSELAERMRPTLQTKFNQAIQ